jgi:hypothetical protein
MGERMRRLVVASIVFLLCAGAATEARACNFAMEHRLYPLGAVPDGLVAVEWSLARSSNFEGPRYWHGTARLVVLDPAQEVTRVLAEAPINTLGPGPQGTLVPLIRAWSLVAGREPGYAPLHYEGAAYCGERFVCDGGVEVRWDAAGKGRFIPGAGAAPVPLEFPTSFIEAHRRHWGIEDEPKDTIRRVLAADAAEATAVDVAALDDEGREEHYSTDARYRLGVIRRYSLGARTLTVVGMHHGRFGPDDPGKLAHEGAAPDPCRCDAVETCWCHENTLHHGSSFDVVFLR